MLHAPDSGKVVSSAGARRILELEPTPRTEIVSGLELAWDLELSHIPGVAVRRENSNAERRSRREQWSVSTIAS